MDKYTENYGCIVIHNGSKSNNIVDQVFCYRASAHDDFKTCDKALWELSNKVEVYKPGGAN